MPARWRGSDAARRIGVSRELTRRSVTIEETVRPVAVAQVRPLREALPAYWHGVGAARMKAAAAGRPHQAGNLAARGQGLHRFALNVDTIRVGCSGKQQLRVGVLGLLRNLFA